MSVEAKRARERGPLAVLCDVVVAPRSAFDALRERPRWLAAFAVTSVLAAVATFVERPVAQQVIRATLAARAHTDPSMAGMSPDKQARVVQFAVAVAGWQWVFLPAVVLMAALVTALVLRIAGANAKDPDADRLASQFARLFALAANVAVVYWGVGLLYVAVVAMLRGPTAFTTASDLLRLWPSAAWFVPGDNPKVIAFLASFNVFALWSAVLLTLGQERIARTPRVPAAVASAVVISLAAAAAVVGAR